MQRPDIYEIKFWRDFNQSSFTLISGAVRGGGTSTLILGGDASSFFKAGDSFFIAGESTFLALAGEDSLFFGGFDCCGSYWQAFLSCSDIFHPILASAWPE